MPARTVYLIKRIETEVTTRMNKALSEFDITVSLFTVLNFVRDNTNDISAAQLSRRFGMTSQSMNEVVATLLRKGLIEKSMDMDNKRVQLISLTKKGADTLEQCNNIIDTLESNFFGFLPESDLHQFRDLIGILLRGLRQS